MAQSADIAREGPFDTSALPMDTEDSLLVTTGLPGCPYRFTSYNGPAISDTTYMAAMGLWRPQTDPGDPGPVPASSCNASMNCRYCFPEGRLPPE